MKKLVFCALAFLLSAVVMQADVFNFSYSGSGLTVTGTLTATATLPGVYSVTGISGTRNGTSFDASPIGAGLFSYNAPTTSAGSLAFSLGAIGLPDTVTFAGTSYTEVGTIWSKSGNNFSITRVPEPTTLSLLLAMGLGTWVLARKLPSKNRG